MRFRSTPIRRYSWASLRRRRVSDNGNPTTNNLFLIDGVNNNDTGSNASFTSIS